MKTFSIFADESGDFEKDINGATTLVLVLASNSQLSEMYHKFNELKDKVSNMGIDTSNPKFEFHAVDLFNRKGYWGKLDDNQIRYIGKEIQYIIVRLRLPYVIVLIDKRERGIDTIEQFKKDVKEFQKQYETHFVDLRATLERLIPQKWKNKGMGKASILVCLLFGLASGLIGELSRTDTEYKGESDILIDDQFIKQVDQMKVILQRLNSSWLREMHSKVADFWGWEASKTPEWRVGSDIQNVSSRLYYGVQAADFVAYTTKYQWEHAGTGRSLAAGIAVTSLIPKERTYVNFPGYRGIYVNIPRWAVREQVINKANNQFWKRRLFRRNK